MKVDTLCDLNTSYISGHFQVLDTSISHDYVPGLKAPDSSTVLFHSHLFIAHFAYHSII